MYFEGTKVGTFGPATVDPVQLFWIVRTKVVLVLGGIVEFVELDKVLHKEKVPHLDPTTLLIPHVFSLVPCRPLFKLVEDPDTNNQPNR